MNRYRITAIRNKAVLVRTLVKGNDMEAVLAAFKASVSGLFGPVGIAIESEQVFGEFDRDRDFMVNSIFLLDGSILSMHVGFNGWYVSINGVACPLSEVDPSFHAVIKEHVRNLAYEAGYYTFKVPGPSTSRWTRKDWMDYVTYNFPI